MTPLPFRRALGRTVLAAAIALSAAATPGVSIAETFVGSWNIRNLGWGDQKDHEAVAAVAGRYDLLAVQEVMTEEGLEHLLVELERTTGVRWQALKSHRVGRGSYKEMYAFLFRPDRIEWVDGAVVYIDDRDVFEREPFSAVFRSADGGDFVLASAHLIYGDSVDRRRREAAALAGYRDWLEEAFPGLPVFIAGDFNLQPSDTAWSEPGRKSFPLIRDGATTLGKRNGSYANLYDNIWAPSGMDLPIAGFGIDEFPAELLRITHEQARAEVSDHAPVFMVLDESVATVRFEPWLGSGPRDQADVSIEPSLPAVIGNSNSGIYHVEGCPGYSRTSQRNRALFDSEAEALTAGYRRARNC
ncbi:DNAse [Rhodobacteraceae bacterium 2CG4]|uniref:DNAse n=1 Tax=Halovulum marinum TaxID=2662447 RepID=A0A6L5Z2X2_9RHOB|nr:endonuclease/exonuclease/phosphatase family protein [Halovulum marinum]MSU90877.1 DNAse [Halovulum marinum]